MDNPVRTAGEAVLAAGAATYSLWVQYLDSALHWITGIGGVIALALLIYRHVLGICLDRAALRRSRGRR